MADSHTTRRQFLSRSLARALARPMHMLPPCDLAAEGRLIGACLNEPALGKWVLSVMQPEQFADNVHELIMRALRDGISPLSLNLAEVGGASSYVYQLRRDAGFQVDDMASIIATHRMRE